MAQTLNFSVRCRRGIGLRLLDEIHSVAAGAWSDEIDKARASPLRLELLPAKLNSSRSTLWFGRVGWLVSYSELEFGPSPENVCCWAGHLMGSVGIQDRK